MKCSADRPDWKPEQGGHAAWCETLGAGKTDHGQPPAAPAADGPVWRDRGVIIAQQQTRIAELEAEVERLRALVGDEDQPGWGSLSRAEAIRQANEFHTGQLRWIDEHDKRRAERDEARAELAALRGRIEALADGLCECGDESCVESAWLMALRAALAASPAEDTTPASGITTPSGIKPGGMQVCPGCRRWGSNPGGLCTNAFHDDTTPAAPHAEDGALCDGCRAGDCIGYGCQKMPAPVADPSGDTEGGQA